MAYNKAIFKTEDKGLAARHCQGREETKERETRKGRNDISMTCIYMRDECTNDDVPAEVTSCDHCPLLTETDEFASYVEWIKGEDMKLRMGEARNEINADY